MRHYDTLNYVCRLITCSVVAISAVAFPLVPTENVVGRPRLRLLTCRNIEAIKLRRVAIPAAPLVSISCHLSISLNEKSPCHLFCECGLGYCRLFLRAARCFSRAEWWSHHECGLARAACGSPVKQLLRAYLTDYPARPNSTLQPTALWASEIVAILRLRSRSSTHYSAVAG